MRQVLERYCRGDGLVVNMDMKELGTRDVNQALQGFWEFRSQGRMTETRLFGFFARVGAFVATSFRGRDELLAQQDWIDEHASSLSHWNALTQSAPYLKSPWPVRLRAELKAYLDQSDD